MAVATPKITWAKGVGADYIRAVRSRVVAEMVARARLVYDSSRPFRAVVEAIPWPHVFFKSFVYTPLVEPGPFRGVPFWDHEALMEQGYFTLSADRMRADLARWLSGNIDALQKHFEAEVKRFIKQKEAEAKRKAAPFIIVDWILQVFGFVASFVLPILGSIASAAISAGWKVLEASQVGQIQKDALRKILKVLKIDPASIDRLSAWVSEWATKAVPADVLDVRVEGRSVGTASSTDQAAALAVEQSQTGDRIEIISIPDGRSSGLLVRTETAVVGVPPTQEQAIQSMPPQSVQIAIATADAAQPKPSGFPVWIVPLVGMLVRS